MSITDELREWAKTLTHWWYDPVKDEYTYTTGTMPPSIEAIRLDSNVIAIADRIDAEHERQLDVLYRDMSDAEWVRLPKDADGVPIHVGDELDYLEALHPDVPSRFKVQDMFYSGNGEWRLRAYPATYEPEKCRHHHAPTVEDVLTEFGIDWEHESDCEDRAALLKEYAAKLRLAETEDA